MKILAWSFSFPVPLPYKIIASKGIQLTNHRELLCKLLSCQLFIYCFISDRSSPRLPYCPSWRVYSKCFSALFLSSWKYREKKNVYREREVLLWKGSRRQWNVQRRQIGVQWNNSHAFIRIILWMFKIPPTQFTFGAFRRMSQIAVVKNQEHIARVTEGLISFYGVSKGGLKS